MFDVRIIDCGSGDDDAFRYVEQNRGKQPKKFLLFCIPIALESYHHWLIISTQLNVSDNRLT